MDKQEKDRHYNSEVLSEFLTWFKATYGYDFVKDTTSRKFSAKQIYDAYTSGMRKMNELWFNDFESRR